MASTKKPTRKLGIRLLRKGHAPADSLRGGVKLKAWDKIPGAQLATGTLGGESPDWVSLLELPGQDERRLRTRLPYALLFLKVEDRWFCLAFGSGHVKLRPGAFENNFGLRVALNEVDPEELKSVDVRTPDSNTLMRRSQSSQGSDQAVFGIDFHQDILRVIAGKARDRAFAKSLAGSDALTLQQGAVIEDLPRICAEAYERSRGEAYKRHFGWIDQILHIRDVSRIADLESRLVDAMTQALQGDIGESLHLAFPEIYDPEQQLDIRYRGFRSRICHPDLGLDGYLQAMRSQDVRVYELDYLTRHRVHEVDGAGRNRGKSWRVGQCIGCELRVGDELYVLSGGKWYAVNPDLARQVEEAFDRLPKCKMPPAGVEEKEPEYNQRVGRAGEYLCMDRCTVWATGAATPFEVCDLLGEEGRLVHVKNGSAASRLSHLFEQGVVSARTLKVDDSARKRIREKIIDVQKGLKRNGFENVLPGRGEQLDASRFPVVYAVIRESPERRLSFFSLLALSRAEEEIRALGYPCEFAWIERQGGSPRGEKSLAAGS